VVASFLMTPVAAQVTEEWVARYNGPANGSDYANALAVDSSGSVYVTGSSDGEGSNADYATVKYDRAGNEEWVARYNGPGNNGDVARALAVDSSGNVYVTGGSTGEGGYTDYATVKYDSAGNEEWIARYNGPANGSDYAQALAVDSSGNVYVTGGSAGEPPGIGFAGEPDYATIKYVQDGLVVDITAPTLAPEPNLSILWPPNHNMVDITINANASDDSGLPPTLSVAVTSNEPQEGLGDGDMTPDWTDPVIDQETGVITLQLRAERSELGEGRIYTVAITAEDDAGNASSTNVEIIVPHDQEKK
jgi:hypothetical protein